jgi:hypothetical protein
MRFKRGLGSGLLVALSLGLALVAARRAAADPPAAPAAPVQAATPPPAAAPKTPPAPTAAKALDVPAPKRAKVTCAQYRDDVDKNRKHAFFDTRLKAGEWGFVPPELRKLPPRAKLCGADRMGQVVIASPLFGKDLEAHYGPLFEKMEFKPLACEISRGQTRCHTKRHRDVGIIVTDADREAFVLALVPRSHTVSPTHAGHD